MKNHERCGDNVLMRQKLNNNFKRKAVDEISARPS